MAPLKSYPNQNGAATKKTGSTTRIPPSPDRNQSNPQNSSFSTPTKTAAMTPLNCPYHGPIINLTFPTSTTVHPLSSTLSQYLNAAATEDPGIFGRIQASTSLTACICGEIPLEHIQELAEKAITVLGDMAGTQFEGPRGGTV